MQSWFEIKVRGILGRDPNDDKEVVLLGRRIRWNDDGIEWEADPRHREKVLQHFGFGSNTKPSASNGVRDHSEESDWEREELQRDEATQYRSLAASINFFGAGLA